MKTIWHFIFVISLMVNLPASGQHKVVIEAEKLNDSAVMLKLSRQGYELRIRIGDDSLSKLQLALLNKATAIDSAFYTAYFNKFGVQCELKQYAEALATGKEMIRLRPGAQAIKYFVGKIYYKIGDTLQAKIYYQDCLAFWDHELNTTSVKSISYNRLQLCKAFVLILLNEADKGHAILKKLYEEANDEDKYSYNLYMHLTKADLIEDKELTMNAGNKGVSIFFPF